jgi:hypothetical protein
MTDQRKDTTDDNYQMTEAERWPTTGSEESFVKLSTTQMMEAGFTPDSATWAEFEAFRDKCNEEQAELEGDTEYLAMVREPAPKS